MWARASFNLGPRVEGLEYRNVSDQNRTRILTSLQYCLEPRGVGIVQLTSQDTP